MLGVERMDTSLQAVEVLMAMCMIQCMAVSNGNSVAAGAVTAGSGSGSSNDDGQWAVNPTTVVHGMRQWQWRRQYSMGRVQWAVGHRSGE